MKLEDEMLVALLRGLGTVCLLLFAAAFIFIIHEMTAAHRLFDLEGAPLVAGLEVLATTSAVAFILFVKAFQIADRFRPSSLDVPPGKSPDHGHEAFEMTRLLLIVTPLSIALYIVMYAVEMGFRLAGAH